MALIPASVGCMAVFAVVILLTFLFYRSLERDICKERAAYMRAGAAYTNEGQYVMQQAVSDKKIITANISGLSGRFSFAFLGSDAVLFCP